MGLRPGALVIVSFALVAACGSGSTPMSDGGIDCSRVGCAAPPPCGQSCTAVCGCCSDPRCFDSGADTGADASRDAPADAPCDGAVCAGSCVDLSSNKNHCGMCNKSCGLGTCVNASCVCPMGTVICATGCADLTNDAKNCGTCGYTCGQGMVCVSGQCA